MTRKDYILIATALRNSRPAADSEADAQWGMDVSGIALSLQQDNPLFDMRRFIQACGVED